MANIHDQINKGELVVSHQGEERTFNMPEWMQTIGKLNMLQDEDKLVAHLQHEGLLLGFLHAGLKECLVGLRAHIRPKEGVSISLEFGAPEDYKPKSQDVPGLSKAKTVTPEQAIATLQKSMSKEELLALIEGME